MKIIFSAAARSDVLGQVSHYLEETAYAAASRFPDAVDRAVEQIRDRPAIGAPRVINNPRLDGLRSWPIPGFEDVRVYYLHLQPNLIRIVRVLHGRRDLGRILGNA